MTESNVEVLCDAIEKLRRITTEIKEHGKGIPAVERNADRILSNVKMLELNVIDAREFL